MTYRIYFAGDLFNHKDLIGNLLLAEAIEECHKDFICDLPQNSETPDQRARDIRNADLAAVMRADMAIFNFDGTDLDSGTVVEFMMAKFLDIPAVLLRTDFREAGDQGGEGDPWNLMCSFYPRTRVIQKNAMADYQKARSKSDTTTKLVKSFYKNMANDICCAFQELLQEAAISADHDIEQLYAWARSFPGGDFSACISESELRELVS